MASARVGTQSPLHASVPLAKQGESSSRAYSADALNSSHICRQMVPSTGGVTGVNYGLLMFLIECVFLFWKRLMVLLWKSDFRDERTSVSRCFFNSGHFYGQRQHLFIKHYKASYIFSRRYIKLNLPWSSNSKSFHAPALNAWFFLHQRVFESSAIVPYGTLWFSEEQQTV